MKENKLLIITILMTAAVVGLISIQIYFINNAFMVEEIRFDENMRELLRDVSRKIEKQHAAKLVINKINSGKNGFVFMTHDSLAQKSFNWYVDKSKPNLPPKIDIDIKAVIGDSSQKQIKIIKRIDETIDLRTKKLRDSIILGKQKLVTEIVDELVTIKQPTLKREMLDSLIQTELKNRGLDLSYLFAVTDFREKYLLGSDSLKNDLIMKSKIRIPLPINDFFSSPNSLVIYFPEKNYVIVKSITFMLILSFIVIVLIIYLFYKTIQMFLAQKKVNEVKNDLINNITHEFKTPISTISLACDVLSDTGKDISESSNKYLSIIKDENTRLQQMVENLLDNAALEKDELLLNKRNIELKSILQKLCTKYQTQFEQKNGSIQLNIPAEDCIYSADEFHLSAAISNIIDNSIKYSINPPAVKISLIKKDNRYIMEMADNGIGISNSEIKKIFATFYRIPTGNIHNVRGYGIGLSYAKKIIERHQGTISVESKINLGSIFRITLPNE